MLIIKWSEDATEDCVLRNKRTNWDLFREQARSTLNTQVPLKDHNDIIQAIECYYPATECYYTDSSNFNAAIQQAA